MSAAFTPGPWRVRVVNRASGEPIGCNILYPEEAGKPDVAIASVYTPGRADACLIAAAPELYEALEIFANARVDALTGTIVLGNVGAPEAVKIAKRALAKARGQ